MMKPTYLIICAFLFLFIGINSSCQKEDSLFWEISPESENPVIQTEVDGIEFKFCLLNEQGEPSTVFNKGENFSFQFSFKSFKDDTIIVTTEFINDEFFRVYHLSDIKNTDMGKPWTGTWCEYSGEPQQILVTSLFEKKLRCPWRRTENSVVDYPLCKNNNPNYLEVGDYFTSVNLGFHFQINGKESTIDNLKFKINFEIK